MTKTSRKGELLLRNQILKDVPHCPVPDQFFEVDLFLADDGLVTVLEKLTCTVMTTVEGHDISSQEFTHEESKAQRPASQKEVSMIRQECPRIACRLCLGEKGGKPINEVQSIRVGAENVSTLNSPYHDVVKDTGCIETGSSRHANDLTLPRRHGQLKY
jgi:hypothetical protein